MDSSYKGNNYSDLISSILLIYKPKKIIEFGILNGYSLDAIIRGAPRPLDIIAYDIFQDYEFNHADRQRLENRYASMIQYGNFYNQYLQIENNSIDMFHIDVSNTGDTYQFTLDNYMSKLTPKGIILLEGGSEERDNLNWMQKYSKPKIQPVLQKCKYFHFVFEPFPSLTLIVNRKIQ
jgi:predicted O-methyltransferase YrrM